MENVLADLYEGLGQLRYPGIVQVQYKDFASTVLTAQNRMSLLSWLLNRSSPSIAEHLGKYKDARLEAEIVKCFSQLGICTSENALRGACSLKQQLPTLKLLLQFITHLNEPVSENANEADDSTSFEIFDKRLNEDANIIPASFNDICCMSNSEAKKYLEVIKKDLAENVRQLQKNVPEIDEASIKVEPGIMLSSPSQMSTVTTDNKEHDAGQILSLSSNATKFASSFDSITSWPNSKSTTITAGKPCSFDDVFESLHTGLSALNQALSSKAALADFTIPKGVDKIETPLNPIVEDNAICTEEASNLLNSSYIERKFSCPLLYY